MPRTIGNFGSYMGSTQPFNKGIILELKHLKHNLESTTKTIENSLLRINELLKEVEN